MEKRIAIEFEYLGRFTARLFEEEAPNICAVVWANLPLEGTITHGRFAGLGITTFLPQLQCPMENIKNRVECGDVGLYNLYWDCPAPELSAEVKGEICIYYGNMIMKHVVPPAIFARIEEKLEDLKTVCRRIYLKGPERIRLAKT
jgi:hypothetical protein